MRANAERYGIDPDKIAVAGGSAGGHLAALLGTSGGVRELEGTGGFNDYSSRVDLAISLKGQAFPYFREEGMVQSINKYFSRSEPHHHEFVCRR